MQLDDIDKLKELLIDIQNLFENLDNKIKDIKNKIEVDNAEQEDWLHELELAKLNGIEIMKVANSLKNVRVKRRIDKDKLEVANTMKGYTDKYITKGILSDTKQAIINLDTLKKNQETREYTARIVKNLKCAKKKEV